MNIVEAYIEQFGFFYVIFTSTDHKLLKEVVYNLSDDFNAQFIDAYPIMINVEDIDHQRLNELLSGKNPVKFIIAPVFPSRYTKVKSSFHINLSLNETLISRRNIDRSLVDLENKYKDESIIQKYYNIAKYKDDNKKLEDDIFNILIKRINKKLDDGNYEVKLKNEDFKEFKTEKIVSKKYDHDKKEEYLEEKNKKVDEKIFEEIEDSEPSESIEEDKYVETEDVNSDDEKDEYDDNILLPTKDFSDLEAFDRHYQYYHGGYISGTREINREYGISGKRVIKKNEIKKRLKK
tara:strand:+ start:1300 stop:2175 length:876 start_codon:yes stop_codon:yes gene_type:complete